MRRLARILLNAAPAVSLALCLATAVLWVRSQWASDDWGIDLVTTFADHPLRGTNENVRCAVLTGPGTVTFARRRGVFGTPPPLLQDLPPRPGERRWTWRAAPAGPSAVRAFSTEHTSFFHHGNVDATDALTLPLWLPAAAFAVLPLTVAVRR